MRKIIWGGVAAVAGAALLIHGCAGPGPDGQDPLGARAAQGPRGEVLYALQCAACHGTVGDGKGPAAEFLYPRPRDFTPGKFKFRSTQGAALPSDEDLAATVRRGIPASAMPSFAHLPAPDIEALVGEVKRLSVRKARDGRISRPFVDRPAGIKAPLPEGLPKVEDAALVKQGRAAFEKANCAQCHGTLGRGDGTAAATLLDDWNVPIPPRDFTRGLFKGGDRLEDLYYRITTGIDGTPMPSHEKILTAEERWAAAAFVKSLVRGGEPARPPAGPLRAGKAPGGLPVDPADPAWSRVEPVPVALHELFDRRRPARAIEVQALHDGRALALRLSWPDEGPSAPVIRAEDFTDGVAVQFSFTDPPGPLTMGDKDHPVNIWMWKLDRQLNLAGFRDIEDLYPGLMVDSYPLEKGVPPADYHTIHGHRPIASAPSHDPAFLTGWGAGNLVSDPRPKSAAEDLYAQGFGTLKAHEEEQTYLQAKGIWAEGGWRVVFHRNLDPLDPEDLAFKPGQKVWAAFAAWDGALRERDGQKSVTGWVPVELER